MDGMDGMGDMGGMMGGMDSESVGLFYNENTTIARAYWFAVAAFVGVLVLLRMIRWIATEVSVRQSRRTPGAVPSRPNTWWEQAAATTSAIGRELSYPQPLYFQGRISRHFSAMPLGRWLLLASYWSMLLAMLWTDVLLAPSDPLYPYHWEKVAFRAAWVSVTQVPLIFCLSAKLNVVSLLTGISYERLQWAHRWAARTLLVTVVVHWSYFYTEWAEADFVATELAMMPMVQFGFGAWAIVVWTALTSISLVRSLCYELFVLQHFAAAGAFLWALYTHVPAYAQYNVWVALGFLALDWIGRGLWLLYNNLAYTSSKSLTLGYAAHLQVLPHGFVRVIVHDVRLRWRPGQHVYLSAPAMGAIEAHPFTIANRRDSEDGSGGENGGTVKDEGYNNSNAPNQVGHTTTMTFLVKAHTGFTRRLLRRALRSEAKALRVLLHGPFGAPPDLRAAETLVFVASGSGAAFTVPLLQEVAHDSACTQHVTFWWIVRSAHHVHWFRADIEAAIDTLNSRGVSAQAHFVITDSAGADCSVHGDGADEGGCVCCGNRLSDGSEATDASETSKASKASDGGCEDADRQTCCEKKRAPSPHHPPPRQLGELAPTCSCTHIPAQYRTHKCLCPLFATCTRSRAALERCAFADPEAARGNGLEQDPSVTTAAAAAAAADERHAATNCCSTPLMTNSEYDQTAATKGNVNPVPSDASPRPSSSALPLQSTSPLPLPSPSALPLPSSSSPHSPPSLPSRPPQSSSSSSSSSSPTTLFLHVPACRPRMAAMVQPAVERAYGATGVVACGGGGLAAAARSCVAALSDARGVHKGSGAQAVWCWAEKGDW